ncbi:sugar ABC transporter substrate-binding protein [Rhizobium sp. Leaf371]|uniref:sugar ABC transporter substrate-binding protein n=1 Tax=Rhizobium sp. Leaf371 TaxID=1736355 RepID=UPI000715233C|nr:sugar ABC transporter substrate-binding protein [Rhizobium sp. Leaf371]KQS59454.1 sugar ABC transporter substrate-binding protein [Rhizobium sp. Leaf371]
MNGLKKILGRSAAALMMTAMMAPHSNAEAITLGYVVASMKIPYNVATRNGFEAAAREAGVTTIVLDPDGSVEKQAAAVDELLAKGVDGIGFLPMDSMMGQAWSEKSAAMNIPNVSIAVQIGDSKTRDLRDVYPTLSALVTTDDVATGFRAGELSVRLLPPGRVAKIAIVEGAAGYSAVTQRTKGFIQALEKAGANYEIVEALPSDWTPESGMKLCKDMIAKTPDLDLIFSQADDMALGCARSIQASGSKVKLMSTGGGSTAGNDAVAKGEFDGSVCTRPALLGRLMFKVLFEGATNPKAQKAQFITYDSVPITKDTLQNCPPEW